jgi:hypothetical protein
MHFLEKDWPTLMVDVRLIKTGFEQVTKMGGVELFTKRV